MRYTPNIHCPRPVRALRRPAPRRRTSRRGMGMIELLIAMSISASLLTAVAVAVDASFRGYKANQEQAILMQRSRVSLNFLCTSIRTTKLHAPITSTPRLKFETGATVTDTGIEMFDLNDNLVKFEWDVPKKRLMVTVDGKTHVLAQGVENFSVRMEPMRSAVSVRTGGDYDLLRRATVTLTVRTTAESSESIETTNTQTLTLSGSVMPRRNVW